MKEKNNFVVTGVYHMLLEAILELKLVSAEQLTRRYYKAGSLITVKNRLTLLQRNGFVDFVKLPTTEGNAPYIYFLARKGRTYFRDLDGDIKEYFRPGREKQKHLPYLMHMLELNDILVAASLFPKFASAFTLVDLLHDIDLYHNPLDVTTERSVKARVEGEIKETWREETIKIIPDALLEFRRVPSIIPGKPYDRVGIWLEHNRNGGAKRVKPKIRAMVEVIASGRYRTLLDVDNLKVAITTSGGEYRKRKLRTWTEEVLEDMALSEKGTAFSPQAQKMMKAYQKNNLFYFATTPPLSTGCIVPRTFFQEKVWFMPFSSKPVALLPK
jgi:hypothetical protein